MKAHFRLTRDDGTEISGFDIKLKDITSLEHWDLIGKADEFYKYLRNLAIQEAREVKT